MSYLITFAISAFLLYIASRCKGVLAFFVATLGIMLPCFMAGLRNETIGVDVLTYAKWMCISAQGSSLIDFFAKEASVAAPGWNLMTWLVCHEYGNLNAYLFVIEALCIVPVYLALRRFFPGSEWAGMLVWYLLFFAFTMNGMRQSVASAIVLYSTTFVFERRKMPFFVGIIIATFFHQTAIVCLIIYPLVALLLDADKMGSFFGKYQRPVVTSVVLLAFLTIFILGDRVVRFAAIFKESYSYQLGRLGGADVSLAGVYLIALGVFLYFFNGRRFSGSVKIGFSTVSVLGLYRCFIALFIFGGIFFQLNFVADTLGRLAYYFLPFLCCATSLCSSRKELRVVLPSVFFASVLYFVAMTIVLGKEAVYPYASALLGIG